MLSLSLWRARNGQNFSNNNPEFPCASQGTSKSVKRYDLLLFLSLYFFPMFPWEYQESLIESTSILLCYTWSVYEAKILYINLKTVMVRLWGIQPAVCSSIIKQTPRRILTKYSFCPYSYTCCCSMLSSLVISLVFHCKRSLNLSFGK